MNCSLSSLLSTFNVIITCSFVLKNKESGYRCRLLFKTLFNVLYLSSFLLECIFPTMGHSTYHLFSRKHSSSGFKTAKKATFTIKLQTKFSTMGCGPSKHSSSHSSHGLCLDPAKYNISYDGAHSQQQRSQHDWSYCPTCTDRDQRQHLKCSRNCQARRIDKRY